MAIKPFGGTIQRAYCGDFGSIVMRISHFKLVEILSIAKTLAECRELGLMPAHSHLAVAYVSTLMIIMGRKCCRCIDGGWNFAEWACPCTSRVGPESPGWAEREKRNLPKRSYLGSDADKSKQTLTCLKSHRPDLAPEKEYDYRCRKPFGKTGHGYLRIAPLWWKCWAKISSRFTGCKCLSWLIWVRQL